MFDICLFGLLKVISAYAGLVVLAGSNHERCAYSNYLPDVGLIGGEICPDSKLR